MTTKKLLLLFTLFAGPMLHAADIQENAEELVVENTDGAEQWLPCSTNEYNYTKEITHRPYHNEELPSVDFKVTKHTFDSGTTAVRITCRQIDANTVEVVTEKWTSKNTTIFTTNNVGIVGACMAIAATTMLGIRYLKEYFNKDKFHVEVVEDIQKPENLKQLLKLLASDPTALNRVVDEPDKKYNNLLLYHIRESDLGSKTGPDQEFTDLLLNNQDFNLDYQNADDDTALIAAIQSLSKTIKDNRKSHTPVWKDNNKRKQDNTETLILTLIGKKADVSPKNTANKTALDLAHELPAGEKRDNILDALKKASAIGDIE